MRAAWMSLLLASCATAPATRSPLREALQAADRPRVEEAATTCLTAAGWKVDPLPGMMADADVLTAARHGGEETKLYVHGRDMMPRLTGGPDDRDPFWTCLAKEIVAPGTGVVASDADAGASDAGTASDAGSKSPASP